MIIKKELKELNIFEKTHSITTDEAANMLKVADKLGGDIKQIYCVAHHLHLVVCNGLGLRVHAKQDSSLPILATTSTINKDEVDSDEEDFSDDIQLVSQPSPINNSSNFIVSSEQSLLMANQYLNMNNDDVIVSEIATNEEPNNLSVDIVDNWSMDVIEYLNPSTSDSIQQHIGDVMKKCRSIVKLINKSSILMNYVLNLKK
ncbi:unnamed protein product [Rotaria sp. Silwood2]|nr:unnamed protein product [Rotaria sp. Silwood2]